MIRKPRAELHNHLVSQIGVQILNETKATRRSYSDCVENYESVVIDVVDDPSSRDAKELNRLFTVAKTRHITVRLGDSDVRGATRKQRGDRLPLQRRKPNGPFRNGPPLFRI